MESQPASDPALVFPFNADDPAQFALLLIRLNACEPARDWCQGKTFVEAWQTCTRLDWMIWLLSHLGHLGANDLRSCDQARERSTNDVMAGIGRVVEGDAPRAFALGTASATGDEGTASATGYQGTASATGYQGTASATGEHSLALGTKRARVGEFGMLILKHWDEDKKGWRGKVAYAGEDGIEAGKWYELDSKGAFVKIDEPEANQ